MVVYPFLTLKSKAIHPIGRIVEHRGEIRRHREGTSLPEAAAADWSSRRL